MKAVDDSSVVALYRMQSHTMYLPPHLALLCLLLPNKDIVSVGLEGKHINQIVFFACYCLNIYYFLVILRLFLNYPDLILIILCSLLLKQCKLLLFSNASYYSWLV